MRESIVMSWMPGATGAVSFSSSPQARCSPASARRLSRSILLRHHGLPHPMLWALRELDYLIADPQNALDVFDFGPVARKHPHRSLEGRVGVKRGLDSRRSLPLVEARASLS